MERIGIRELKNQVTEILRTVREQKIEYIVTYRGLPIARLSPLAEEEQSLQPELNRASERTRMELVEEIEQILAEKRELPAQNRRALEVLREWLAEPDETDETWWREFNADLARNRFNLRRRRPLE